MARGKAGLTLRIRAMVRVRVKVRVGSRDDFSVITHAKIPNPS